MFTLIHESGSMGWGALLLTLVGLVFVVTVGRMRRRPGSMAAAFAVAVLAIGAIGVGLGQRNVDRYVESLDAADIATRVKVVSLGTREASANLLFSGMCALVLSAVGGGMALGAMRAENEQHRS